MLSFEIFLLCIYETEVSKSLPLVPPGIFFFRKISVQISLLPEPKRACDKYGLDWIGKTWINKTRSDITRIYEQVRKGFFFLGFIGSEYDKHDLVTVMFQ